MLMVAEIMPATSDSVPLIGGFFLALRCTEKNVVHQLEGEEIHAYFHGPGSSQVSTLPAPW